MKNKETYDSVGKGGRSLVSSQFDSWNSHGEKRKPTHAVV